ncbi:MAG: hypothetical protein GXP34_00410 [Actinobacteria bacterium]|nr:hypothetical protein [Actinomycetota bacterium]
MSLLPDEFFPRLVKCLNDHGYAVTLNPDYTISGHGSVDSEQFLQTRDECAREIDPGYVEDPPPFTETQLESFYSYVKAEAACFAELGYPLVQVPSFDKFLSDLPVLFDPVAVLIEDLGVSPTNEEIATCRWRNKPEWLVAP